jgi:hypothetical protein
MKTTKPTDRRNFLLAAGLGSAGVAAAVVTAGKVKVAADDAGAPDPKDTKYRASAHILKYYKTTEV